MVTVTEKKRKKKTEMVTDFVMVTEFVTVTKWRKFHIQYLVLIK